MFFFHIFPPLPSPKLVFQFGLDLRCRSECLEAKLYHRLRLSNSQQRQEMLENLSQVGGWENLTRKNDGTWWKSRFMKFGTPYFHPKNRGIQMFNQQLKLGMQDRLVLVICSPILAISPDSALNGAWLGTRMSIGWWKLACCHSFWTSKSHRGAAFGVGTMDPRALRERRPGEGAEIDGNLWYPGIQLLQFLIIPNMLLSAAMSSTCWR